MKLSFPETNGGWKKYEGNPVLGDEKLGTCFDVLVLKDGDEYVMHFSWRPKKALAMSRSKDGIHWSEPRICMESDPECGWMDDLNRHCIVRRGEEWHMWFTGQARGYSWIGYAVSDDGLHWRRVGDQPVMVSDRPYEGPSVMNPFVMWDEDIKLYRMWYAAGETYEPRVLAYATSPDGIHWDKLPANPIFVGSREHPCEQDRVGACQVVKCDGWHYMFYIGYEDIDTARICVARSRNGITNWQRLPENPIVSPTIGGWDENACYKPSVIRDEENKRWLLWYNGRRKNAEYIGLVIHEGLDLGFSPAHFTKMYVKGRLRVPCIQKNSIHIGLEKPIKVMHVTDSHILPCDEIDNEYKKWLVGRFGAAQADTMDALKEQIAYAEENCDLMLHTGDLIDYVTKGSVDIAREVLQNDKILFITGNHDYVEIKGENWIPMNREKVKSLGYLGGNPFFHSRVYGGVNFVGIDNSNHQVEDWQTARLQAEAQKGLPIVLLLHVPIFEQSLYECGMAYTGGNSAYLMGCDEEHLAPYPEALARDQRPTTATKRFVEYVNSESLIKAVVAGHVHFNFESTLPGGAVQYVTGLGFNGEAREITIT